MRDSWLTLIDSVLRPARSHHDRCVLELEQHLTERRAWAERRAREIASCVRRIETARSEVFAANDGVISLRMTELEREWRLLSRPDLEHGLMDLWARIAPPSWIDRKRWRDCEPAARTDAALALASDVEGVEAAEVAIGELRDRLTPWGIALGTRIRWRAFERDEAPVSALLAGLTAQVVEAVSTHDIGPVVLERAADLEQEVLAAATARLPERPMLARDLGRAAFFDFVCEAASLPDRPNPAVTLRQLWTTGYSLSAFSSSTVDLELPLQFHP